MFHLAPILLCLVWSGFVCVGMDQPFLGGFHWFGLLGISVLWCFMAMIKAIFDQGEQLRFSDGISFITKGEYRLTHRSDGWYVVGRGMLCPVSSAEDGLRFISEMKKLEERKDSSDD